MNKSELVATVAERTGENRRAVQDVLDAFQETVQTTVKKGEQVSLPGFLTFKRVDRKARTVRNPQTGELIKKKASKAPRVSLGTRFKATVSGESAPAKAAGKKATAKASAAAKKAKAVGKKATASAKKATAKKAAKRG